MKSKIDDTTTFESLEATEKAHPLYTTNIETINLLYALFFYEMSLKTYVS